MKRSDRDALVIGALVLLALSGRRSVASAAPSPKPGAARRIYASPVPGVNAAVNWFVDRLRGVF